MNMILNKYINKLDIHTAEVLKKSFGSSFVKLIGMAVGFVVSVVLGRVLGAEGLGVINLSSRIVVVLSTVVLLGMQQVIIKEVAIANNKKNFKHITNVMFTAFVVNGGFSILVSIPLIFLSPWIALNVFSEPLMTFPLIIGLLTMTPQIFSRIFSSGLIGLRKIWQSNLVDQTLSIAVTGLLLLFLWFIEIDITINKVALLFAIGRVFVAITIGFYWKSLNHYKFRKKLIIEQLSKTARPLFVISLAAIVMANANMIIIGLFGNLNDVGYFSVALRLALLSSFFLQITNSVIAPKLAALFAQGKIREMEKMVQQVTKGLAIIGIVPFIIFLFAGKYLLEIWGNEFVDAYWVLIFLSAGQLVNLGTGAVGLIMIMTGHEKVQSKLSLIFAALNLIINIILVYYFGALGAAIGTAIVIAASNIAKMIFVKKLVGIQALPINI